MQEQAQAPLYRITRKVFRQCVSEVTSSHASDANSLRRVVWEGSYVIPDHMACEDVQYGVKDEEANPSIVVGAEQA